MWLAWMGMQRHSEGVLLLKEVMQMRGEEEDDAVHADSVTLQDASGHMRYICHALRKDLLQVLQTLP